MRYPDVLDERSTLRAAHRGRSLARYGDGEIKLALGRATKSQTADPALAAELRQILKDTSGPCLPCIPRIAHKASPKEAFWAKYRDSRVVRLYSARQRSTYGSSFITRPDSAPQAGEPDCRALLRDLWRGQDVVLVRGSLKSLAPDLMTDAASLEEVIGPRENAWSAVPELCAKLRTETRRVLICLGPAATVLAWRLAADGVHALDLGHAGMFLRKAERDGPAETDLG